jgi:hydrogenase nickel incorporation protein HypB
MMTVRRIDVRERVLARNDELASEVRGRLLANQVPAFNLVSSPGAGKTLLLEHTLEALGRELDIAVITGDVQTQNDADRLARHTDRLVQAVVTGGACHLDARQVLEAISAIDLPATDLLFIENVGNLVCPAAWDLGEAAKIVIFSVTEGEDKPAKYPRMFERAQYVVLSKLDLLPYVPFDVERAVGFARDVNPHLQFFFVSALTGEGMSDWYSFLRERVHRARGASASVPGSPASVRH